MKKNLLSVVAISLGMLVGLVGCNNDKKPSDSGTPGTSEKDVAVTSVSLNVSENKTLKVNETIQLTATVAPENATNKNVTWSSSDATIAKVENGLVTALKVGEATISAVSVADNTKKAEIKITVEQAQPEVEHQLSFKDAKSVTWADDNSNKNINTNDDFQMVSNWQEGAEKGYMIFSQSVQAGSDKNNHPQNVIKLASGSKTGILELRYTHAIKSATVEVSAYGSDTGKFKINNGEAKEFTEATAADATSGIYATIKEETAFETDTNILRIETLPKDGKVNHRMFVKSIDVELKESTPKAVTALNVTDPTNDEIDLKVGETKQIVATVSPDDAADKSIKYAYINADASKGETSKVFDVSETGLVTAKAVGKQRLKVNSHAYPEFGKEIIVNVTAAEPQKVDVTAITLTPSEAQQLEVGKTLSITAAVAPENATDKSLTWSSSNEEVATVANGVVTGVKADANPIKITATSVSNNTVKAELEVTVKEAVVVDPAATLTKAKNDAKTELDSYKLQDADYTALSDDDKAAVIAVKTAEKAKIDAAVDKEAVTAALAAGKTAVDGKITELKAAAEAAAARVEAVSKANAEMGKYNLSDYDGYVEGGTSTDDAKTIIDAKATLQAVIDDTTKTAAEIDAAVEVFKNAVSSLKTTAQKAEAALVAAKKAACDELDNFIPTDYENLNDGNKAIVDGLKPSEKEKINAKTTVEDVNQAKEDAKNILNSRVVELLEQEVTAAKTAACTELDGYKNDAKYTPLSDEDKSTVDQLIANKKDEINADTCSTKAGVKSVLDAAKIAVANNIEELRLAQLKTEALTLAKGYLPSEYNGYTAADDSTDPATEEQFTDDAKTVNDAKIALLAAVNAADATSESVQEAINTFHTAVDSLVKANAGSND